MRVKLLPVLLLLNFLIGRSEVPNSDQLWESFITAVNSDVFSCRENQRENERKFRSDSIDSIIIDLKSIFNNQFESDAVNNSFTVTENLISNVDLSTAQLDSVKVLYNLLCKFESESKTIYDTLILDSNDKAFKRIGELMQIEDLAPVHIQWIASDLKKVFKDKGLFEYPIAEEYVYLNFQIKNIRESLESIEKDSKGNPKDLMMRLRTVLDVVNKISPDFAHVNILFDQLIN